MKSSISLNASLENTRFHLRFRPVPRCEFCISLKASSGSCPAPPGSAYPRLCYRHCRMLHFNSLPLKLSRACHDADANIGDPLDAPHTHCYGIMVKRTHANKHKLSNYRLGRNVFDHRRKGGVGVSETCLQSVGSNSSIRSIAPLLPVQPRHAAAPLVAPQWFDPARSC